MMMFVLGSFSYCHYEKLLGNLLKINALVTVMVLLVEVAKFVPTQYVEDSWGYYNLQHRGIALVKPADIVLHAVPLFCTGIKSIQ